MRAGLPEWLFVVAVVLCGIPRVDAGIINGDFETGNVTGWAFTVHSDPIFGDTSGGPAISTSRTNVAPLGHPRGETWYPRTGNYFATLVLGAPRELLSVEFHAEPGGTLSFDYFFDYGDAQPHAPDAAYGRLVDSAGTPIHSFFEWNLTPDWMLVTGKEVPWSTVTHTFTTSGVYRLLFGVANPTDFDRPSVLGVDNVRLTLPEPATAACLLLSAATWVGAGRRRSWPFIRR